MTACIIYGEGVGDRGKAGPQLISLQGCDLPVAETGLGLQASPVASRAKGAPEASFLVEVGKAAPSTPSVSILDHEQVPLDSRALCVGELASGPVSRRSPAPLGGSVLGLRCLASLGSGRATSWRQPGVGLSHSCVVSRGRHSEYVNVSGCWRETYNSSSSWEGARLPEAPKCSVSYNVCFMANEKIHKICTQAIPCLVKGG